MFLGWDEIATIFTGWISNFVAFPGCLVSFCSVAILIESWLEWGSNVTWDIVKHCSRNKKRNITVSSMLVLTLP